MPANLLRLWNTFTEISVIKIKKISKGLDLDVMFTNILQPREKLEKLIVSICEQNELHVSFFSSKLIYITKYFMNYKFWWFKLH